MDLSKKTAKGGATRIKLKQTAQRLFAQRGIAAIGMRQIVEAANQRNAAAIHYHFGSKDDLIRELLIDGADAIDRERQAMLDQAESVDAEVDLRAVVSAMVLPSLAVHADGETTYLRFLANASAERRVLVDETIQPSHAFGYQRCIAHVRRILSPLPQSVVDRRLMYSGLTMEKILCLREQMIDETPGGVHAYWGPGSIETVLDAVHAVILAPSNFQASAAISETA